MSEEPEKILHQSESIEPILGIDTKIRHEKNGFCLKQERFLECNNWNHFLAFVPKAKKFYKINGYELLTLQVLKAHPGLTFDGLYLLLTDYFDQVDHHSLGAILQELQCHELIELCAPKSYSNLLSHNLKKRIHEINKRMESMTIQEEQHYCETPRFVSVDVTDHCNLYCKHCRTDASMIKKSAILKKQFYSLLDELNHMRIFSLQLSGGEPFTRDDMPELLRYARRINQDWLLKLATNGTLVDEEIADLLKEIKVDLVSVSIDGLDQIHNDFRKMDKSFQMTVDGIKLLIQRGLYVLVNTVIHRENLGQFEAIVKFVYDEVKPSGHRMSIIYPAGRGADDPRQFFKFDEHEDIWTRYMKLKEQYTCLELRMPFLDLPKKIDNHDFTYLKGCVAGKSHCSIQACGDVSPCKLSLYHRAGNIYDQTLHAIWRGSGFEPFRGFNSNDIHDDKCRQCRYLDLCRGGCRVVASQLTGDFHARDPWCEVDLKQLNFVAL